MEIVDTLNTFISEHFNDTDLQLSFFAAQLDLTRRTLTYSGAGHPGPLLIHQKSREIEVLQSQNMLIGVADRCLSDQPEDMREVNSGDRLILFTDGLTETTDPNGTMLGTQGLARLVNGICGDSLFDMADCILERVAVYRSGPAQDDLTLIIAELK